MTTTNNLFFANKIQPLNRWTTKTPHTSRNSFKAPPTVAEVEGRPGRNRSMVSWLLKTCRLPGGPGMLGETWVKLVSLVVWQWYSFQWYGVSWYLADICLNIFEQYLQLLSNFGMCYLFWFRIMETSGKTSNFKTYDEICMYPWLFAFVASILRQTHPGCSRVSFCIGRRLRSINLSWRWTNLSAKAAVHHKPIASIQCTHVHKFTSFYV